MVRTDLPVDAHIITPELADSGRDRIEWAWSEMPVLRQIGERFAAQRPLERNNFV